MLFYWGLFWSFIGQYLKGRMAFRGDFFAGLVSDVVYQSIAVIFLLVVFSHVPLLAGWRREEVFFVYGYFLWPYAFFGPIGGSLAEFTDRYIIRGEMDRLLLRPINTLFHMILDVIDLSPLMGIVTGSSIMLWAGRTLGLQWRWYDPLLFFMLVSGSVLIYFGIYLSLTCISFWYDGRTGLIPLVWNVNNYGRYPVSIYNRVLRLLFTWVFPFAFVGFYPAAFFLRRDTFYGWSLLTIPIGILFYSLSYWLWKSGLRRYHSTGS